MKWKKVEKKLPKKTDYYLISDGSFYSVGIFFKDEQKFFDKDQVNPILDIRYWAKIPLTPNERLNIPQSFM